MSAHQHVNHIFGSVFQSLHLPQIQILESLSSTSTNIIPADIVDQNDDMRIPIETFDDRVESLLSCGIPYFHFDVDVLIDFYYFCVVLNPESNGVVVEKLIGEVALDEARFSGAGFADDYDLEDEVV